MELRETGKAGAAAVLLWPDDGLDAAVFASVVRSLEKSCRVLVPVFAPEEPPDARVAAVESALLAGYDGRIWGAYGLRGGGSALLSLLAEGKVRVRTCVVEGAVEVPAQGLREFSGTLFHWKGSKDKGAAKGVPLWSHMTRVEPCGEYGAVCVDQVEISAGALTPAVMRAAEIYLKAVQKSRNRQMRKE